MKPPFDERRKKSGGPGHAETEHPNCEPAPSLEPEVHRVIVDEAESPLTEPAQAHEADKDADPSADLTHARTARGKECNYNDCQAPRPKTVDEPAYEWEAQ